MFCVQFHACPGPGPNQYTSFRNSLQRSKVPCSKRQQVTRHFWCRHKSCSCPTLTGLFNNLIRHFYFFYTAPDCDSSTSTQLPSASRVVPWSGIFPRATVSAGCDKVTVQTALYCGSSKQGTRERALGPDSK